MCGFRRGGSRGFGYRETMLRLRGESDEVGVYLDRQILRNSKR
jgi:hypothetical protein